MGMTVKQQKVIDSFRGRYAFLSNFYPVSIKFEGMTYSSVEHAFQAAKSHDPAYRAQVAAAVTPAGAKRLGHGTRLRQDWMQVRLQVMEDLVLQKFAEYLDLMDALLKTNDAVLIEGSIYGDVFWGATRDANGELVGQNNLGKILMKIREEITKAYYDTEEADDEEAAYSPGHPDNFGDR